VSLSTDLNSHFITSIKHITFTLLFGRQIVTKWRAGHMTSTQLMTQDWELIHWATEWAHGNF
jgi:hypothetical protein